MSKSIVQLMSSALKVVKPEAEASNRDMVWEALESAKAAARLNEELSVCELIQSIQAAREAGTVGSLAMLVELKWH